MIIIQIRGGLGNQLFTYAFAYSLARKYNKRLIIDRNIYDTSYVLRKYMLDYFPNITNPFLIKCSPGRNRMFLVVYKLIRKFKIDYLYQATCIKEEKEFELQNIKVCEGNIHLDGYWQNYRYFNEYRDEIKKMFSCSVKILEGFEVYINVIKNQSSVAIHIRRGDYVTFNGGECLSTDYYADAMKYCEDIISNVHFYVFTDDVQYCKTLFQNSKNVTFISDMLKTIDIQEFFLMTICSHFIIANSSFSWWAAYLGEKKDSIVIAPIVDLWTESFYLDSWIRLNATVENAKTEDNKI